MAGKTAFILVFGLAGSLSVPAKQPPDDVSLTTVPSLPLEVNKTFIPESPVSTKPPTPETGKKLEAECEGLCKVCNLTSEAINGSCKCLDKNGSEVICTVRMRENIGGRSLVHDEVGGNGELDVVKIGGEEESEGMRGERCLLTMARSQGVLQNKLGQGLKGMSTEERLAEFRKRVEALRRKPFESDKTKECDRGSEITPDRGSTSLFVLPVSPFMNTNLGKKLQKDGKESEKIEEDSVPFTNRDFREKIQKDEKESVKIEGDNVPFINSNLGKKFQKDEKESIQIEKENVEIVGEIKPSFVTGGIASTAKSSSCLAIPYSPVRHSVKGSADLTESSGYSGIKLPSQFLALTKIRERMVDLGELPDDDDDDNQPIEKGKQILPYLKPLTSVTSITVTVKPPASPMLPVPETNPVPTIVSPCKISSGDEILQSNLATSSLKLPVSPDQKEKDVSVLETGQRSSQYDKQGPILEGIIAIPKYVRIK